MTKRKLSASFEVEIRHKKAKKILQWAKEYSNKHWFVPKKLTKDGFFTSYGPRNEILFIGDDNTDEITEEKGILKKLELVFNEGINYNNCFLSVADYVPYFTKKYKEYLIQSDATKEQALQLTDEYSFAYVIDASREKNLTSFPATPCNTNNPKFFQGAPFDAGTEYKYFFIIPSSLKPSYIIGAFAIDALAHDLNVSEETLIINPNYDGSLEKIRDKLKINAVKELKDCQATTSDYHSAVEAYNLSKNNA